MSKKLKNELVLSLMKERIKKEVSKYVNNKPHVDELTDKIMRHIIFAAKSID